MFNCSGKSILYFFLFFLGKINWNFEEVNVKIEKDKSENKLKDKNNINDDDKLANDINGMFSGLNEVEGDEGL